MYSIVSAKRDTLRDASSICKTRVTYVTLMDDPYWWVEKEEEEKRIYFTEWRRLFRSRSRGSKSRGCS